MADEAATSIADLDTVPIPTGDAAGTGPTFRSAAHFVPELFRKFLSVLLDALNRLLAKRRQLADECTDRSVIIYIKDQ
jgi:hypothetical protein